ncbi:hypothetical protein BOSE21B_30083 [Bosea sp. 21B]|nr:hypothetical protein BOSE21B_30083 [Bosea sp. 21B]
MIDLASRSSHTSKIRMSGDTPKMRLTKARPAGLSVPIQMMATSGLCERMNSTASNIANGTPMMVAPGTAPTSAFRPASMIG